MHERWMPADYSLPLFTHTDQCSTVAIQLWIWGNRGRSMLRELVIFCSILSEPPLDHKLLLVQWC